MDLSKQEDNPQFGELKQDFAHKILGDNYQLEKQLYKKKIETAYLAKANDNSVSTKYFIQQFTPKYSAEIQFAAAQDLFNLEAANLKNLGNHPQIPLVYDYFVSQGQFFLIQEFILGQSLSEELSQAEPYSQTKAIEFLNDILPVLQFVHENNCIHRDINPAHLIRNSLNQRIYLTNFPAIKEKVNPENLDITGQFIPCAPLGSKGYVAIEQSLGRPQFCSDFYALGIVVIQALTQVKLTQLQYDDNNNPVWHHLLPDSSNYHPQFLGIIDGMVCCNYRQRYQSAIAIIASLKELKSSYNSSENTVIVNNKPEPNYQATEHTLIINNSEPNAQLTEHTLIIQNNDLESTRIITSGTIDNRNNSSKNDNHQFTWKIVAIVGSLIAIIIIIILLSGFKNNQNSTPQKSSFIPDSKISKASSD